jgi:hypothetical protein
MTLQEAINNPCKAALPVLLAEYRRRGGDPANPVVWNAEAYKQCSRVDCKHCDNEAVLLIKRMPMSLLQRQLKALGACEPSITWAGQFSTAREAWNACEHGQWMRWLILKYSKSAYDSMGDECWYDSVGCDAIRREVPFERLRELSRKEHVCPYGRGAHCKPGQPCSACTDN